MIVTVGVVRDEQPVHPWTAPVPIGAAEEEAHVRQLQLDVRLLGSVGALTDQRITLSKLDHTPTRELRIVQQVVIPTSADEAGDERCRPIQIQLERGEYSLLTLRPQRVAVGVTERFDSGAELGVNAHLLRKPFLQQLDFVSQLALDLRGPLHFLSGELPIRLRLQDGLGNVDPTVGLNERRQSRDASAGDEQVDVVVDPVAQGQVGGHVLSARVPLTRLLRGRRCLLRRAPRRAAHYHAQTKCQSHRNPGRLSHTPPTPLTAVLAGRTEHVTSLPRTDSSLCFAWPRR